MGCAVRLDFCLDRASVHYVCLALLFDTQWRLVAGYVYSSRNIKLVLC
jgi:hypothetical protein